MQKPVYTVSLLIFTIYSISFIDLFCQNKVECVNSKNNYLYVGVDNGLKILLDTKNDYNTIFVSTSNGIIYEDSIYYNCIPKRSGRARIKVHGITNSADTVQILTKSLMVYTLPQIKLTLGGRPVEELKRMDKNFLFQNDAFDLHISDDIIDSKNWIAIEKVTMGYLRHGGYYQRDVFEGNRITDEIKNTIRALPSGKELSFEVRLKFTGNVQKNLPIFTTRVY